MTHRPRASINATTVHWQDPPWPAAFELAGMLPTGSWTLIGGLMVKLHAAIAGLPASRTTTDVDSALHLETNRVTFAHVAGVLLDAGYVLEPSTRYAYRFDRGEDRVDIMCSDRYAIWRRPRFNGRPLFGVPGATRALQQTIDVDVETDTGTVRLVIPSLRGALVLKGAALLEDPRDRGRHSEDAVLLLACLTEVGGVLDGLSQRSRGRLRALIRVLQEQTAPWVAHDPVVQSLGRESLEEVAPLLGR